MPAFDIGSDTIINEMKKFTKKNKNSVFFVSLGSKNYLSILKHVDLLIGNSSSGLIEAPIVGTKVINIGQRQDGRIRPKGIINIKCKQNLIIKTIKRTLMKKVKYNHIYPNIRSSNKFIKIVEKLNLRNSLKKTFVDLK